MLTVVPEENTPADGPAATRSLIDEIVREGARRMLAAALEAEVDAYIAELADQRDERGRRLVVRNGHAQPRRVMTAAGAVEVQAPRVNDRRVDPDTGERQRFSSAILPPWCRRSPKIAEVLPLLYLHGLSSGDFVPALEQFLGSGAGLSASTVTRLTSSWQADYQTFTARDLSGVDYVYIWADGIHVNIRLDEDRLCLLVLIGVRADGRKELLALADGYRESTGSWADLLRDCPTWTSATRSSVESHSSYLFAQVRASLLIVVDLTRHNKNRLILVQGPEVTVRPVAKRLLARDDAQ